MTHSHAPGGFEPPADRPEAGPGTLAVRAGTVRSAFGEHSEALFLTSSFVFDSAAQAAARFAGDDPGFVYSRYTNPTTRMFEERLAALEGAECCVSTASGMAAILATVMGLMQAGDHVVASRSLFGATTQLFDRFLAKFGITTTYVALTDLDAWRAACGPRTRLFFVETPSNPLTEIADIRALADIAHAHGAWLAVDNCFCTPALQRPLALGADLVTHSATKYLDGQGRVMGGAVLGAARLIADPLTAFLRNAGATLAPFNAWVILKGLETLRLRMVAQSAAALELATWLEAHPAVARVFHPALASHPQHALAMRQQSAGGAIVSFEVHGGRDAAWRVVDACRTLSITANLGDTRSTITHPASTTHGRIAVATREAAGIGERLLRIAVGLEDVADLQRDLARGLGS
ncbi:MAG: O-succinylhomoserine sulfhydrylase [Burkholderiales bacterium]|jgi:O-succinylhomoserine sulfhydrylase|nr:O-succinylhomoserine sulfhydrylase [Burkholderiales bacterium]